MKTNGSVAKNVERSAMTQLLQPLKKKGKNRETCLSPFSAGTHQLHLFLTSSLDGDEWSTSHPCPFNPRRNPGTHWLGGWVGPRAGLDIQRRALPLVPARIQAPKLLACNKCVKQNSLFLTLKPHPVDAPLCSFDKQFIRYRCSQWKYTLISVYRLLQQWIAMLLLCQLVQCSWFPITSSRWQGVCHQDGQECAQGFLRLLIIQVF